MWKIAAVAFLALPLSADWPGFRGPNNSGIAPDDQGPADVSLNKGLVWKIAVPAGLSSPVIVNNRVYLTGWDGNQRIVLAYDAKTGTELWRRAMPKQRDVYAVPENGHATPTLATDGKNLFAFFHDIGLISFSLEGKERWRVPIASFSSHYGLAASPVVEGGLVFVWVDGNAGASLRVFDAATGAKKWTADHAFNVNEGYATPVVYRPANGPAQIIVFGAAETSAYQAVSGERLWAAPRLAGQTAASPVIYRNMLYVCSPLVPTPTWADLNEINPKNDEKVVISSIDTATKPFNVAWVNYLTAIEKKYGNGDGTITKKEYEDSAKELVNLGGLYGLSLDGNSADRVKWRQTKSIPFYATPLVYRDVLYTLNNGGILISYDASTGAVKKQGRVKDALGEYWAAPVAGGGRLYTVNVDGRLSVLKAGAEWDFESAVDLGERVSATPALSAGRLYVRSEKHLYCFGSK
jgi:outer membrane protein assembly factor BamB